GHPTAGADLRYDIRISFEEAVRGADKEIEFPVYGRCETCNGTGAKPGSQPVACDNCGGRGEIRTTRRTMLGQMVNVTACPKCNGEGKLVTDPCETCNGEGRTERKRSLRVSIPAGIDEGHQIRLSNEGEVGVRGGAAGSLYVAVHVTPHPQLRREGTELFYEADVSIAQAALGTSIAVPTTAGAWLELSVAADVEAVEAVSEILARVAPGGTSVEPAFELVEEGLGARIDPTRPSIVRAYVPARDPAAAERAAAEAGEALGHLQAFGLRPIGELT